MKSEFLKPKLVGRRFDDHSIPVEVLRDWAAFEGLIVETARWLYLEENPVRRRIPRGFAQSFSLNLSGVEDGSAIAVLDSPHAAGHLLPGEFAVWFEKARDRVLDTIKAASLGRSVEDLLPKSLLGYFDQFGRALRDDERVEFSQGDDLPIVYDKRVRKTLVLKSAAVYRTVEAVRGSMSELNLENRTFTLKLINGEKVVGQFGDELRDAAHSALGAYGESLVMVEGAVVRDQTDNRKRIEQVTRIEPLDALDVPARLEALSGLRDGWMDGEGARPNSDGLNWLSQSWLEFWPGEAPLPYVYPTIEGGLQLEWSFAEASVSVEIDLALHTGELLAAWSNSGEVASEVEVDLAVEEGWLLLAKAVQKYNVE